MNLNINCYNFENQLDKEESIKGATYAILLPAKILKLLKIVNNNLYCVVDLDSIEKSFVQFSYIPPNHDIKYIDKKLNDEFNSYQFLGEYEVDNGEFVFLFGRVLTEKEIKEIDG